MVQLSWNCMEKPQQENATGLHTWSASLKVLLSNDMKVLAQESIRAGRKTDGYTCIHVIHVSGGTRFSTNTNCIACCCMYHWDMMTATTTACAWKTIRWATRGITSHYMIFSWQWVLLCFSQSCKDLQRHHQIRAVLWVVWVWLGKNYCITKREGERWDEDVYICIIVVPSEW